MLFAENLTLFFKGQSSLQIKYIIISLFHTVICVKDRVTSFISCSYPSKSYLVSPISLENIRGIHKKSARMSVQDVYY